MALIISERAAAVFCLEEPEIKQNLHLGLNEETNNQRKPEYSPLNLKTFLRVLKQNSTALQN